MFEKRILESAMPAEAKEEALRESARLRRIHNDTATEFSTACAQVERIAELRLKDQLP